MESCQNKLHLLPKYLLRQETGGDSALPLAHFMPNKKSHLVDLVVFLGNIEPRSAIPTRRKVGELSESKCLVPLEQS